MQVFLEWFRLRFIAFRLFINIVGNFFFCFFAPILVCSGSYWSVVLYMQLYLLDYKVWHALVMLSLTNMKTYSPVFWHDI